MNVYTFYACIMNPYLQLEKENRIIYSRITICVPLVTIVSEQLFQNKLKYKSILFAT